jgi:hypothetical protein
MKDFYNFMLYTIFILGISFLFIAGIAFGKARKNNVEVFYETETYIYSVNDNSEVSGKFFLGFGKVEENWEYSYYYKTEFGYKIGQINADDVYVVENDELKPQIRTVNNCVKNNKKIKILFLNFEYNRGDACTLVRKELIVPKNTIKTSELDLN